VSRQSTRKLVALLGAAAVLVIADWVDTVMVTGIRLSSGQTFDVSQMEWALPFGYLTVAAGGLAIVLLARWAQSVLVGLVYALVGAFFAFLFPIIWLWAAGVNGATPVLPGPIVTFLTDVYINTEQGSLNAVAIIGAGMLLVGLASIGYALRNRASPAPGGAERPRESEASPS
jgi:hypothetical protein